MEKWMVYAKRADFNALAEEFGIDPVVARILVNRDLRDEKEIRRFLSPSLEDLGDERLLKGMDQAVSLLRQAIESGAKIRIIGDYDVDGIMSTYILKTALTRCGGEVDYAIPDRVEDGYGMNASMVRRAAEDGRQVLLTCDNGIAAAEEVKLARELGMTVIVTDHHEIPFDEKDGEKQYRIPEADAVINPKQPGCPYPWKNICGAMVAWKLALALYAAFDLPREEAMEFLEFAAFATVGDVMELKGENRSVVALGLKRLQKTKNLGMATLIGRCQLADKPLSAYHIGFVLGPCFNASGRLDTAVRGIELLEEKDPGRAAALAQELQTLNEERKVMTETGVEEAVSWIEREHAQEDAVLVIYLPDLHESLAGIVAGRIRERYYRPTLVLTDAREGVKGSGRSIPEYSMYEKLSQCSDLLTRFGGHPMAAGFSLERENISAFRRRLNELADLTPEDLTEKIMIDVPMPLSYLCPDLIRQLERLEPFGNGNEKPVFAQKGVIIRRAFYIGKQKQYLKFVLETENGCRMDGLYFGDSTAFARDMCAWFGRGLWEAALEGYTGGLRLSLTYYPQINTFRGQEQMQVVITGYCK